MAHQRFLAILWGCGLLLMGVVFTASAQDTESCATLKRDLAVKRQQLSQHVDALKKLDGQNELTVMAVFNGKIRELIEEIQQMQASADQCPHEESLEASAGLGTVKSEVGDYATKSCDELRTMLLQLVQKTVALKRRQGSLFSALTQSEKNELEEADRSLKELKSAIRSRCVTQDTRTPARLRR